MEEQIATPIPSPKPKPKPSSDKLFKIAIIIIGLLIILGLFGNIYLLTKKQTPPVVQSIPNPIQTIATPTLDPTADWKTYINQEFGYSIKYSTGYIRLICPGGELILLERQAMKEDTVEWNTCEGGIFEIKTQKEQFEIPQSGPYEIDGIKYSKLVESKEVLVDSIKAQEYKIIDKDLLLGQNFSQFWVVFSNKGKNYKIVSLGFEKTLLDLMLSTFKFLP